MSHLRFPSFSGQGARLIILLALVVQSFAFGREVVLPKFLQARIQAKLERIYHKIRIAEDPEKPPRFILVNTTDTSGYVERSRPGVIYIDVKLAMFTLHEDIIAAVLAHEMQHLLQKPHASTMANEVDADIVGMGKRLFRYGQEPGEAPYNADTVLAWLRKGGFSKTHMGGGTAASLLGSLYFKTRREHAFPKKPKINPILADAPLLFVPAFLTVPTKMIFYPVNDLAWLISDSVKTALTKEPGEQLVSDYRTLERFVRQLPKQGIAKVSPEKLLAMRVRYLRALSQIRWWGGRSHEFLDRMDHFFSNWEKIPKALHEPADYLELDSKSIREGKLFENYIEALKNGDREELRRYRFAPHSYSGGHFLLAYKKAHLLRLTKNLKALSRKSPADALPAMVFLAETDSKWSPMVVQCLSRIPLEEALSKVDSGLIPAGLLPRLDEGPDGTHRLGLGLRLELAQRYLVEYPEISSRLLNREPETLRREFSRILQSKDPISGLGLITAAVESLPHEEVDATIAQLLQKQANRWRNTFRIPEETQAKFAEELKVFARKKGWPTQDLQILELIKTSKLSGPDFIHVLRELESDLTPALSSPMVHAPDIVKALKWSSDADTRFGRFYHFRHQLASSDVHPLSNDKLRWLAEIDFNAETWPRSGSILSKMAQEMPFFLMNDSDFWNAGHEIERLMPWREVFSQLTADQIRLFGLSLGSMGSSNYIYPLLDAFLARLVALVRSAEIDYSEAFSVFSMLSDKMIGFVPGSASAVAELEKILFSRHEPGEALRFLRAMRPNLFASTSDYLAFARRAIEHELTIARLPSERRSSNDTQHFVSEVKEALGTIDPLLKKRIMEHLAERVSASLGEKPFFDVKIASTVNRVAPLAEHANALLATYENLPTDYKWQLLQWIRGRDSKLSSRIREAIRFSLLQAKVRLNSDQVEDYIRDRFESLSPLLRAGFFKLMLDGKDNFLTIKKNEIKQEAFGHLEPKVREVVEDFHYAAQMALPASLRALVPAIAFAESGKHSSPEEAAVLLVANLGPLYQKIGGQNLPFEESVPESYREAFRKMWSNVPWPDWWEVQELLHRQMGDIEAQGYRLVKIRNAGTTEIFVELEDANGGRHGCTIQRKALGTSTQVDYEDMVRFVDALESRPGGKKKYGWMRSLVNDAYLTMRYESDPTHKPNMAPLMEKAYRKAALKIGGHQDATGRVLLDGWELGFVKYWKPNRNEPLVLQTLVSGVPLQELMETDPEHYSQLTEQILRLEDEVQNDLSGESPIDKDRMPGQVVVDVKNRRVVLLDPGQARQLKIRPLNDRNAFIGSALGVNGPAIAKLLRPMGVKLNPLDSAALTYVLAQEKPALRPLRAISWIERRHPNIAHDDSTEFRDLVHAVRAQVRLGHWANAEGHTFIADRWNELGKSHKLVLPKTLSCPLALLLKSRAH